MPTYNGQILSAIAEIAGTRHIEKNIIITDSFSMAPKATKYLDGRFIFDKELVLVNVKEKSYNGEFINTGNQGDREPLKTKILFTPTFKLGQPLGETNSESKVTRIFEGLVMGGDSSSDKAPRVFPKEITWNGLK